MTHAYFMMSLLILDPKQTENNIDVNLQPLTKELKDLRIGGLETYDAPGNETFHLYAALLWTLNDFPAYVSFRIGVLKGC